MKYRKFKKWVRDYDALYRKELHNYWKKTGTRIVIPEGFDKELLHQYTNYKNDIRTKQFIIVTWILGISAMILSGLTIYFQFFRK